MSTFSTGRALVAGLAIACSGQVFAYTATPLGGAVTPQALAAALVSGSSGITINSVTYQGVNAASGAFTDGAAIFGIANGIVLTSGSATAFGSNSTGASGIPILKPLTTGTTFDGSALTIRFTPTGSQIQFSYVFASAEYPQFVDSQFNDVFGFFVNGTNRALIPGTSTPVAINNINCGNAGAAGAQPFCSLFVDNRAGNRGLPASALGGWTQVFNLTATVNPGVENELILAIADVGDSSLDSAALIAAGTLGVCGGPGQPPCGGPPPAPAVPFVPVPAIGSPLLALLVLVLGGLGLRQVRRRVQH